MVDLLNSLSSALSQNVIELRSVRGLTQKQLADRAGLPRSTLAHIESGSGNPSLINLSKLALALQVSLEGLLATPRPPCQLIKANEVRCQKGAGVEVFKLLPDPIPGMEMDRMELQPQARRKGIPHVKGTREYLTCLSGQVELILEGESYFVEKNDVLSFPGDRWHVYHNPLSRKSVCLSVVSIVSSFVSS